MIEYVGLALGEEYGVALRGVGVGVHDEEARYGRVPHWA